MRANVGRIDATIRIALAAVFLIVTAVVSQHVLLSLVSALVTLLLAATALTRQCPLYRALGVTTRGDRADAHPQ